MSAVEIENAPTIAGVQPDALGIDDLDRVLRKDRGKMIGGVHGVLEFFD
jgi:hypothetical protein